MSGGVGDALIAIGSTTAFYEDCDVTAVVREHQVPLMEKIQGVGKAIPDSVMRNIRFYQSFDEVVNFQGFITTTRTLKDRDYYTCVEDKVNRPVRVGKLNLEPTQQVNTICLHPGASNKNRRWSDEGWANLAQALANAGNNVAWLGPRNEFGFNGTNITKLSDTDETLLGQAKILAGSKFFIGNDSGFSHIAGLREVPGITLYFSTKPESVTARYPRMGHIKAYEMAGLTPTMSLDPEDKRAQVAISTLTAEKVCDKLGIDSNFTGVTHLPKRLSVHIITSMGQSSLIDYLSKSCMVTSSSDFSETADINLQPHGAVGILSTTNKQLRISLANYDMLDRAIWEFRALTLQVR